MNPFLSHLALIPTPAYSGNICSSPHSESAAWDASSGSWVAAGLLPKRPDEKVRTLPADLMAHFKQRECWAGVDLSMTTDLSAVSFVFPIDEEQGYDVLLFCWIPDEGIRRREQRDGMPYRIWVERGFMESCQGAVIDYREIKARLEWG